MTYIGYQAAGNFDEGACFLDFLWNLAPTFRAFARDFYDAPGLAVPGVMSLGAQIGGENKLVWRSVFVIAALLGMFFTVRLVSHIRKSGATGFFARSRWALVLVYLVVLVIGLYPELAAPTGLAPIQVEAFLLCLIVLSGHGLAWEMMTSGSG